LARSRGGVGQVYSIVGESAHADQVSSFFLFFLSFFCIRQCLGMPQRAFFLVLFSLKRPLRHPLYSVGAFPVAGRVPPMTLAAQDMGSLEFGLPLSSSVSVDSGAH
jgi:hypothetical protein